MVMRGVAFVNMTPRQVVCASGEVVEEEWKNGERVSVRVIEEKPAVDANKSAPQQRTERGGSDPDGSVEELVAQSRSLALARGDRGRDNAAAGSAGDLPNPIYS